MTKVPSQLGCWDNEEEENKCYLARQCLLLYTKPWDDENGSVC